MMKKIFLTLFVASTVLISACGDGKGGITPGDVSNPASASDNYDPEKLPKMEFEVMDYNYGTIKEGEHVKYSFKFKNTGKTNLIIAEAKASCGCTIPEYPEDPIAPGESGEIKADFDSKNKAGGDAKVIKTITVIANTQPNKVVLKLTGFVKK
ncbi:MAG: DUF1573 domain-containing protein [Sphingobacteriales bacterium JAD_PAG50586_3]|nr:MAG: DUF1573 domain-containing protein [Sphingobacteriales bacterium JAD_PAG50586_3]